MADGVFASEAFNRQQVRFISEMIRRERSVTGPAARWHSRGRGGGGNLIWFDIVEVHCPDYDIDYTRWDVEVVDFTGGCTADIPGADDYGIVEVRPGCTSPYTVETLETSGQGWAAYVYPREGDCEPFWRVINHCADGGC